jgi:hypothetical protein
MFVVIFFDWRVQSRACALELKSLYESGLSGLRAGRGWRNYMRQCGVAQNKSDG